MGITDHVVVPGSIPWEFSRLAVGGGQVEFAVVCGAIGRDRVGNVVPGSSLHVDVLNLVREGPVGDGCGDDFPGKPQPGTALSRLLTLRRIQDQPQNQKSE